MEMHVNSHSGWKSCCQADEIWNGLRGLRKDNTGYDLRDLFIGAEGTLGVITAACLKTFPLPRAQVTALFALDSVAPALALLALAQSSAGPTLTAFEFFSATCLQLVTRHFPDQRSPFERAHAQYVLLELSDHEDAQHAAALLQALAEQALDKQLIADAVIAQSAAQSDALWKLRELISEAQAREGKNIKHDISVPISSIARFIDETDALLSQRFPGVRMVTFGHLGDGNLHYNVSAAARHRRRSFSCAPTCDLRMRARPSNAIFRLDFRRARHRAVEARRKCAL